MPTKPSKSARRATRTVANVTSRTKHRIECERKLPAAKHSERPAGRVLIPIQGAAKRLGLSVWTLRSWVYAGRVNFHRVGPAGRVMIADAEIERLIGTSEVVATAA
ncbi:MAG TPA: hypothetical protein VGT08_01190 [Terracidiphilus sp.]|nr:hypothetical protein [Terracidiphilus sp.]